MTFGDTVDVDGAAACSTRHWTPASPISTPPTATRAGDSERMLAELLRGRRDRVTVATKAGMPHPDAGEHSPLSPPGLRAQRGGQPGAAGHRPRRPVLSASARPRGVPGRDAGDRRRARGRGQDRRARGVQLRGLADRRSQPHRRRRRRPPPGRRPAAVQPAGPADRGGVRRVRGRHRADHDGLQPARRRAADRAASVRRRAPAEGRFGDSRLAAMYKRKVLEHRDFRCRAAAGRHRRQGRHTADRTGAALAACPSLRLGRSCSAARRSEHLQSNIARCRQGPFADDWSDACDEVGAALRGPMPNYNR